MVAISVIIITYNEEKNIERCINSVLGIADEIIILDSYSTDKTEEICKRYDNLKFYQHKFDGFIEQKNRAVTHASNPYILSLDADEELSEELQKSISEVKNNWQADGYTFNRLSSYCGKWIKHCGWYPDKKLRLFDSRKGKFAGKNPHDQYMLEKGAKTKYLKGDLRHYTYDSIKDHVDISYKYSEVMAKRLSDEGKKPGYFRILLSPCFKIFKILILKRGYKEGFEGLLIAFTAAYSTFLKYILARHYYNQKNKK